MRGVRNISPSRSPPIIRRISGPNRSTTIEMRASVLNSRIRKVMPRRGGRRPKIIAGFSDTVPYARSQDTPSSGKSLT